MTELEHWMQTLHHTPLAEATHRQAYTALLALAADRANRAPAAPPARRLYYLSAEFLMGRLLTNNLINLGLYDEIDAELRAAGLSLAQIEASEPEPSLGNGGLGRLAACFLDSIATLGLPGDGVGLCYHLGLFRQEFRGRKQVEVPNPWIEPESWLESAPFTCEVPFGGFMVQAVMRDIDVIGYGGRVRKLHLFDVPTVDPNAVRQGIDFDKTDIPHVLTLFLYPDDSDENGHLLRVYQQYFLVSAAAQLILHELEQAGHPLETLHEHACVQINDTHPSMVIPELTRLLMARGIPFARAVEIVSKTCAYTNHTILAEALEKWPMHYIQTVAPQLVPILRDMDAQVRRRFTDPRLMIIDDTDRVHMAHMDIHYGFSVNGVAALHTEILKETELHAFYEAYPERFSNKTNGVTFRRWLMASNPRLAALITERIGEGWQGDALQLQRLEALQGDAGMLDALVRVKEENKRRLRDYLLHTQGISLIENAVYDIQIKRIHEYKRQQMNALYAIHKYLQIKAGNLPERPIVMIFGGKAAPAYERARDIIHLLLCLSELIAADPEVSPWLQLVMVENYNVTLAEKLMPACDISEQISLASKEASGTGNMKFMLGGAVTLGTMDGANVEIFDLVGRDNIFIFGRNSDEVIELYRAGGYSAAATYREDPVIEAAVDFIISPQLHAIGDATVLHRLHKDLTTKDWFMALLDLRAYIEAKDAALSAYEDRGAWARKMLVNTAKAGFFSSDRTIAQYNEGIWRLTPDARPDA